MQKVGLLRRLIDDTFAACVALLASTVAAIVTLFSNDSDHLKALLTADIFLSVFSLGYLLEAGRRFLNVIRAL